MFLTVAWVPYKWDELLYKIRCTIITLNLVRWSRNINKHCVGRWREKLREHSRSDRP